MLGLNQPCSGSKPELSPWSIPDKWVRDVLIFTLKVYQSDDVTIPNS